jgi:hypothetical protein
VRTAIQCGIDEETFIEAAHRAYRDGTSS